MLHRAAPLAGVGAPLCATCSHPIAGHPPCGICNDSRLVRLCPACRHDPANVGWNDRPFAVGLERDAAGVDVAAVHGARELMSKPRRRRGQAPVLHDQIVRALLDRRRVERVERIDSRGRFRGSYERVTFVSRRQVARELGCSPRWVNKVYARMVRVGARR